MSGINQTSVGVYVGTFDPLTNGHCDVIRRASHLFGRLVVGIGENVKKVAFLSIQERVQIVSEVCKSINSNISVKSFQGLAVKFAESEGAKVMVRGLRSEADFGYELQMAMMNKSIGKNIETIFIPTNQEFAHISSSLVKEVSNMGGDVSRMVPELIFEKLTAKSKES